MQQLKDPVEDCLIFQTQVCDKVFKLTNSTNFLSFLTG